MLVGGVDRIGIKAEAHEDDLAFQFFFKKGNDRNASSAALWNWCFSEGFFISFTCRLVANIVDWSHVTLAAVMRCSPLRLQPRERYFQNVF